MSLLVWKEANQLWVKDRAGFLGDIQVAAMAEAKLPNARPGEPMATKLSVTLPGVKLTRQWFSSPAEASIYCDGIIEKWLKDAQLSLKPAQSQSPKGQNK